MAMKECLSAGKELKDKTWSTRYNIPKKYRYSDSSTQWTMVYLKFIVENYGVKLIYDQIDKAHADMCFSNITKTHSVYLKHIWLYN